MMGMAPSITVPVVGGGGHAELERSLEAGMLQDALARTADQDHLGEDDLDPDDDISDEDADLHS